MATYIEFEKCETLGKTKRWNVISVNGGMLLGRIEWRVTWRKYCFTPEYMTEFDAQCLAVIAQFCLEATLEQRDSWGRARAGKSA